PRLPKTFCWRISDVCYWGSGLPFRGFNVQATRIPLRDLIFFDVHDRETAERLLRIRYPNDPLGSDAHDLQLKPIVDAAGKYFKKIGYYGGLSEPEVKDRYFDFLP